MRQKAGSERLRYEGVKKGTTPQRFCSVKAVSEP